jgi:hypothetical protein
VTPKKLRPAPGSLPKRGRVEVVVPRSVISYSCLFPFYCLRHFYRISSLIKQRKQAESEVASDNDDGDDEVEISSYVA